MSFNAADILSKTVSEASDEKVLTAEGTYNNCTIGEIKAFEPHEKSKEKGVEARLLINFDCNDYDGDLSTFMNAKAKLHPKATLAKLMKAVWPMDDERATKAIADLEGQSVNVSVFHEETKIDGRTVNYAEFRFTAVR